MDKWFPADGTQPAFAPRIIYCRLSNLIGLLQPPVLLSVKPKYSLCHYEAFLGVPRSHEILMFVSEKMPDMM